MKRTQNKPSSRSPKSTGRPGVIEPRRLAEARGGACLGITVHDECPLEDIWQQQHNETLIQL